MSSREEILRTIRRQLPITAAPSSPPAVDWIHYDDPVSQFIQVLESVGGVCYPVQDVSEIAERLAERMGTGKRVISGVPGVLESTFDFTTVADPHALADVELAILPGQLAVAENAAVWVQTTSPAERALYFLTQHLALVVPLAHVVHHLHEAYDRIEPAGAPFGCFIAGPSKTADIEQSLVKGAHGARTLNVFLVKEPTL